ncbi:MAG TPA: S-layer homology domain-containing protein [Clostridiaceae bacterium]|nr:S-layer homology domain-containing protein [Clostridiaceae bacterium]
MFTLLYRTLRAIGELPDSTNGKDISSFTDADEVSDYAVEALTYLVRSGIVSGNAGKLSPKATSTRAEMAQVLYNLLTR